MADPIDIIAITEALKGNLETLAQEKAEVRRREREIDLKISALHQSLSGLLLYADALDQTDPKLTSLVKSIGELLLPTNSSGTLTEACRNALRTSTRRRMSAMDVRKALEGSGFDFSGYTSNPLSSIHTTLRRLKENDEVKETVAEGTKFYQWIQKITPATPEQNRSLVELMNSWNINLASVASGAAIEAALKPSKALAEALATVNVDVSQALKGFDATDFNKKLANLFVSPPGSPQKIGPVAPPKNFGKKE